MTKKKEPRAHMKRSFQIIKFVGTLLVFSISVSCASTIMTQNIPLSTNPSGAEVYVDGKLSCVTPCATVLARNQDHLLTFQKEGFHQQDVAVRRQHQTETSLLKAINSGVNSAKFFNNQAWGLSSAVQSLSMQQATGEAYVLIPSSVAIRLAPEEGFPRQSTDEEATLSIEHGESPLDRMDKEDEHMLEMALETSRTGQTTVWTNTRSGFSFAVAPEDAEMVEGFVVRPFSIGARKDRENITARYSAHRAGRAEWVVGTPPGSLPSFASGDDPTQPNLTVAVRTLAEPALPTAKKDWNVQKSSHTSMVRHEDGSVTTKTRSSLTRVGVSINPAAALDILDALKSLDK